MNFVKTTLKNIKIQKDDTEKRSKGLMEFFGETESELRAVKRCSNILKFEAQLEDDYNKGNDTTLTIEVYVVMKEHDKTVGNFSCRNEYHVHWIRNEMSPDGSYPQDDYTQFSGYSSYEGIVDNLRSADKQFEEFKEGKVEKLDFFGIKLC